MCIKVQNPDREVRAERVPATHQRNYGIVLCLFGNTVSRLQQNVWQFHMRSRSVSIFFGPDPRVILARFHQSWVWPMRACPLTVRRIGGSTSCEQLSPVQRSIDAVRLQLPYSEPFKSDASTRTFVVDWLLNVEFIRCSLVDQQWC